MRGSTYNKQTERGDTESNLVLFGDSAVLVDPVEHLPMPDERILGLEHPLRFLLLASAPSFSCKGDGILMTYMMLVWEHDKLARHAAGLENVEHGQTL